MALSGDSSLQAQESQTFFKSKEINFWGTPKKKKPTSKITVQDMFPESPNMPKAVRVLVDNPTLENAKRYLEWQKERKERMIAALRAVEAAKLDRRKP